jgi:hypothetical protein
VTTYTYADERTQPRRKRGRRLLTVLIVLLLVLLGLLVVADRVGASMAEREIGDQIKQELVAQGLETSPPEVSVGGFPFLTQVLAGKYEEIRIELPDFKAQTGTGETVRMDVLDIRARQVTAPLSSLRSGQGEVRAGSVTGTGTLDYGLLADATGQEGLKLAEKDGKLVGSGVVKISQTQEIPLSAAADLKVNDGRVQVRFSDVTTPGVPDNPLIRTQVDSFVERMAFELDVPKLPMNLVIQELKPLPEGLRVTFGATDVALASAGV